MAKDPAFLFYSSDFLTGTMLFTNEQVGKYIRLMCFQHQHGHLSKQDMLKICDTHDDDIFSKFVSDADGKYYNERLETEISKRIAYSESRRKNRESKKDMSNICKSYVEHMENENENINIDINSNKKRGVKGGKECLQNVSNCSEAFEKAIEDFKDFRKKIKAPLTDRAVDLLIAKLKTLAGDNEEIKIAILEQSIMNGWKGVFALKETTASGFVYNNNYEEGTSL